MVICLFNISFLLNGRGQESCCPGIKAGESLLHKEQGALRHKTTRKRMYAAFT
jgi:hypothetical protein